MGPGWCGRLLRVSSEAVAGGRLPLALASQFKHAISSVRWSMKRPASWSSSKCIKSGQHRGVAVAQLGLPTPRGS